MKNNLLSIIILLVLFNCKKEPKVDDTKYDLKTVLKLSNYTLKEKKLRDTVVEYTGVNNIFTIKGKYDKKNKQKYGWWNIIDKRYKGSLLNIEIILDGNKEFNNQVIFLNNNNKINEKLSKFYKTQITSDIIGYKFNTPYDPTPLRKNTFTYVIIDNGKILDQANVSCQYIDNQYFYRIDLSKYQKRNLLVKGLFTESTFDKKTSTKGINEIFTEDTVK